jgi:hypothetical protein
MQSRGIPENALKLADRAAVVVAGGGERRQRERERERDRKRGRLVSLDRIIAESMLMLRLAG